MEIRMHYLLFGIICIIYIYVVELHFQNYLAGAMGGLTLIAGIWGLLVGEIVLRVPNKIQKYSTTINAILILIGVFFIVYEISA